MKLLIREGDIKPSEWELLVKTSRTATWFQSREAYVFFDSLTFLEAFVVAVESDGVLKGLVVGYIQKDGGKLKQFLSKRAIILGGPLLADTITEDELGTLLRVLKDNLKRKAIYIETRNFNDYSKWRTTFEECGFLYGPHYDILVDTSTMEIVNEKIGKSRKRDIKVSMREGCIIVANPPMNQVKEYYLILKELYAKKVKTPLFSLDFFEKLYQLPDSVFLLVEYNNKIVGGTVCVGLKEKALYEMFVCGEDGLYKNIHPSEMATFAGLQYAAEKGYPCFDMMGAGKPGDGYGVRDFKLKFGGNLVEPGRFVCVCNGLLFKVGSFAVKLMKKL